MMVPPDLNVRAGHWESSGTDLPNERQNVLEELKGGIEARRRIG